MSPSTPKTPKTPSRTTTNLNSPSKVGSSPSSGTAITQILTVRDVASVAAAKQSKSLRRVTLHPSIYGLIGLGIANNLVELWHQNDEGPSVVGVGWLGGQGMEQRSVQLGQTVHDLLNDGAHEEVKSGTKLKVRKYDGKISQARTVYARTVGDVPSSFNLEGWRWYLEHFLLEVKHISAGMKFECTIKSQTVSFMIYQIYTNSDTVAANQPSATRQSLYEELNGLTLDESEDIYIVGDNTQVNLYTNASSIKQAPVPVLPPKPLPKALTIDQSETSKPYPPTPVSSIGGLNPQLRVLRTLIQSSLIHSHYYTDNNFTPAQGILLYGPPGTGKTLLLRAISTEANANCYKIDGSLFGKYLGESENSIRKIFSEAKKVKNNLTKSIIFIDEIDSLAPKRTGSETTTSDSRVVTTLLTELDALSSVTSEESRVLVIAATNRPNGIDPGLRRPGRLESEVEIGIPDAKARLQILQVFFARVPTTFAKDDSGPIPAWSARTHGYVGADLEAVVRGAVRKGIDRLVSSSLSHDSGGSEFGGFGIGASDADAHGMNGDVKLLISEEDVEATFKEVRPTAMREIFLEPPKVRWSDIGGQEEVKQRLREAVEWPLTHPELFQRLGGNPRKGLLLYGPPGCSKTLTAKALATEAGLNFMAVKGPELFSMYVGESERAVREIFRKARAASPSIIFFDEIDALGGSREGGKNGGNSVGVLTALLNEMDGIEELGAVVILAATNRPDMIDPALLRPGRLDTILYVGPPDLAARREILKIKTSKMSLLPDMTQRATIHSRSISQPQVRSSRFPSSSPTDTNANENDDEWVDDDKPTTNSTDVLNGDHDNSNKLEHLAHLTDGYSGAEIVNICDEAIHFAMRESFDIPGVGWRHFEAALNGAVKQITKEMRRGYEEWGAGGVRKI